MKVKEMDALTAGDVLLTRDGDRVTFVEKSTTTRPLRRRGKDGVQNLHAAIVDFEDGRRDTIPARSLFHHKGRGTQ